MQIRLNVLAAVLACCAIDCGAQPYPNKPIRIVSGDAGGASDLAARLVAQGLTRNIGQQVVVENHGGSIIIPAQIVAKSPPDGYNLLFYTDTYARRSGIKRLSSELVDRDSRPRKNAASCRIKIEC